MEIAARFLGTRPRSRWEVERRLKRAGAGAEVVEATVKRLAELGYLDDLAFARWWAEQRDRHAPRGHRMIDAELRQHGVPRDVIAQLHDPALDSPTIDADQLPGSELERARAALDRHLRGRQLPTGAGELRRIGMWLVRRGFDPETARTALRRASEEASASTDADL
jgi:regulatory protein